MTTITFCDLCGGHHSGYHHIEAYESNVDGMARYREETLTLCEKCFEQEWNRIKELRKNAALKAMERYGINGD